MAKGGEQECFQDGSNLQIRRETMKLCTFEHKGSERVGLIIDENNLADITAAWAAGFPNQAKKKVNELVPPSMIKIIEGGESSLAAIRQVWEFLQSKPQMKGPGRARIFYSLNEVRLKAPVPRPPKIIGPNWNHKGDQGRIIRPPVEPHPFYAIKLGTSVTGPFDPIEIPDIGRVVSEVEAAIIIGKTGKRIPAGKAKEYIFGYTVLNDVTAIELRDRGEWIIVKSPEGEQMRFTTAARYKCYDTFCPMGPWIVTQDEIDIHNCHMEARVNGELDQAGTTADMVFNFYELISYLSEAHTLEPGDVISSGTVPLAPERKDRKLGKIDLSKANGILESEIQGIGMLRNPLRNI